MKNWDEYLDEAGLLAPNDGDHGDGGDGGERMSLLPSTQHSANQAGLKFSRRCQSTGVVVSNACVVLANFTGFLLTFSRARAELGKSDGEAPDAGVRAYQVYYVGRPNWVAAKEGLLSSSGVRTAEKAANRRTYSDYVEHIQTTRSGRESRG